jgi:hypothetical protein
VDQPWLTIRKELYTIRSASGGLIRGGKYAVRHILRGLCSLIVNYPSGGLKKVRESKFNVSETPNKPSRKYIPADVANLGLSLFADKNRRLQKSLVASNSQFRVLRIG